jgi:hypothetical protein
MSLGCAALACLEELSNTPVSSSGSQRQSRLSLKRRRNPLFHQTQDSPNPGTSDNIPKRSLFGGGKIYVQYDYIQCCGARGCGAATFCWSRSLRFFVPTLEPAQKLLLKCYENLKYVIPTLELGYKNKFLCNLLKWTFWKFLHLYNIKMYQTMEVFHVLIINKRKIK